MNAVSALPPIRRKQQSGTEKPRCREMRKRSCIWPRALDEGVGVSKDPEEARKWYAKAARQEQPVAQLELAREFAGQGNCPVAVHWYEEAAGHGQAQAMYELGRLYLSKCGAKQRAGVYMVHDRRAVWIRAKAKTTRISYAASMPAAQKKHAELAAAKWIKEHPGSDKEEDEEEKR